MSRNIPGILLNSLPNSGSCYNYQAIKNTLGIPSLPIGTQIWFPHDVAEVSQVKRLAEEGNAIAKHHSPASFQFAAPVSRYLDRMWLHVRDPRAVALEWRYSMITLKAQNRREALEFMNRRYLPEGYFTMTKTEQNEVQVRNMLPDGIRWIEGWLGAEEDPEFKTKILFTTYEDFVVDENAHWDRVIEFFEIEKSLWTFEPFLPDPPENPEHFAGKCHFRTAKIDGWREEFTADQRDRACAQMPDRLLGRFGWPRD